MWHAAVDRLGLARNDPKPWQITVATLRERANQTQREAARIFRFVEPAQINDAAFRNRQNGKSDFRIVANTSIIYIRRVTVSQEQAAGE